MNAAAPSLPVAREPLWPGLGYALLIWLGTRLVVWVAAYTGAAIHVQICAGVEPPVHMQAERIARELRDPDAPLARYYHRCFDQFQPLMNWDAGHYAGVIEHGYQYRPSLPTDTQPQQYNIAFFPLYPLLAAPLASVLGGRAALVLFANLAGLAAALALYIYVCRHVAADAALPAVAIVFGWPTACFYSFGYAESLNLLLTVLVLHLAAVRRWWPAAVACGLATATRPTGLTLAPVLVLAWWFGNGHEPRRKLRLLPFYTLVAVAGVLAYAAYLTGRFGSPLVFFENFRSWIPGLTADEWPQFLRLEHVFNGFKYFGRAVREFPVWLVHLTNPVTWNIPLVLVILALSLVGRWRAPAHMRPLLWLAPLIFLQRYLACGWNTWGLESMARYVMLATPALVVLALLAARWRPGSRAALVTTILLLQAMWAFRFGGRDWAG